MSAATPTTALRRRPADGPVAGVCAGLAHALRVDPLLLRVGFVVAALAGGSGLVAYAACWAFVPAEGGSSLTLPRLGTRRGSLRVAAGIGLLVLSALLILRHLGWWFGDYLVWPLALAISGAALIWRQTAAPAAAPAEADERPWATVSGRPDAAAAPAGRLDSAAQSRALLGSALIVGGGLVFLWLTDALQPARDVVLAVVVVVVAGALLLAPWWIRLARGLARERAERIRTQERAEVAAHLHDSVLQTLALVQKRAEDPRAVAALARRQERELRAWLGGARPAGTGDTLAAALERAAAEAEDDHGVQVDVVTVGDRPLDERTEPLAAAAREALVNAAKFAGEAPISLFAEVTGERVQVFVRDRGPGFDLAAVPADRRGVRESIIGRMKRNGGRAEIHSDASGTEVELTL